MKFHRKFFIFFFKPYTIESCASLEVQIKYKFLFFPFKEVITSAYNHGKFIFLYLNIFIYWWNFIIRIIFQNDIFTILIYICIQRINYLRPFKWCYFLHKNLYVFLFDSKEFFKFNFFICSSFLKESY